MLQDLESEKAFNQVFVDAQKEFTTDVCMQCSKKKMLT
jgi:hypothetical protein